MLPQNFAEYLNYGTNGLLLALAILAYFLLYNKLRIPHEARTGKLFSVFLLFLVVVGIIGFFGEIYRSKDTYLLYGIGNGGVTVGLKELEKPNYRLTLALNTPSINQAADFLVIPNSIVKSDKDRVLNIEVSKAGNPVNPLSFGLLKISGDSISRLCSKAIEGELSKGQSSKAEFPCPLK
jgi:hypothetical protein